jgi:hypothetical protein
MRIPLRAALALGLAGVLAACTDESKVPTAPVVPRAISSAKTALNLTNAVCDATTLKGYARNYAAKANDPLFGFIANIPSALKADGNTAGLASANNAFDALAQVAKIRGTSAQNSDATATAFDALVHGLLKCMPSVVIANAVEPTDSRGAGFKPALLAGWVFEVRGKSTDPTGGAYERGSTDGTWWAARPLANATWTDAIASNLSLDGTPATKLPDRVLIYGYRTSTSSTNKLGSTFEHFSIPKIVRTAATNDIDPFTIQATLGLCLASVADLTGKTPRVNHATKFLPLTNTLATECETPTPFTSVTSLAANSALNPTMLAKRAAQFFAPAPLYAATVFAGGGSVTGTPDDWSPSSVWDLSQFVLGAVSTITDGKTSEQIHYANGLEVKFAVTLSTGGAAPVGTPVTVSVLGNQSVIAYFSDNNGPELPTATRYVDATGNVSFAGVRLTKAGGYQLSFQIAFDGFGGTPTNTNSFNIQNK